MAAASFDTFQRSQVRAFVSGTGIGTLAGLIGLGGAEFRLPFLISLFRFGALEAVIINKTMSLVVVASALPFRTGTISVAAIAGQWPVIANLLAGSLLGAWVGASWATKLKSETLYRVIAVLLVGMAAETADRTRRGRRGTAAVRRHRPTGRRSVSGVRHRCCGITAWSGRWRATNTDANPAVRR